MATCTNDTPCGNPGDGHYHSAVCLRVAAQRLSGSVVRPPPKFVATLTGKDAASVASLPDGRVVVAQGDAPLRVFAPERAGRPGDQPLPTPGSQSVFAEVRRRLDEREATGVRRYGRSLETFNGRDAALDLEEELLDGLAYVTQLRLEHAAVVDALVTLARWVGPPPTDKAEPEAVQAALLLAAKLDRRPR